MIRKRFKRNFTKFWTLWSLLFGVVAAVMAVAIAITTPMATIINKTLGTSTTKVEGLADESSSNYEFTEEGEQQLRDDNVELVKRVVREGTTLVKNNDDALPLAEGANVSVFGLAQAGLGEGSFDLREGLEANGIEVNEELHALYGRLASSYRPSDGSAPNEVPWSEVSSAAGTGDAALVVLQRRTHEGSDGLYRPEQDYLALSAEETELLQALTAAKEAGDFGSLVVIVTSSNSIDSEYLQDGNDLGIDVDAAVWTSGEVPAEGFEAVAELLVAAHGLDFSGRLVDTMYVDNQLMPEMANFGNYGADTTQVDVADIKSVLESQLEWAGPQGDYWQTSVTYAEGVYHSYRYYETRYEDFVLNGDAHGAYTGWSYDGYVAAPFGHGLQYNTGISYTGFKVSENDVDQTFEVDVTVENSGATDVQHSVLIYMQTPFTERDQRLGIEEGAIKLVGFEKVDVPAGESVVARVSVDQRQMGTYDEYEAKTYVRDAGTYFLTTGADVHDAMNNILSAKVQGDPAATARMAELGEAGDAGLTWSGEYTFDDEIFSTSRTTDVEITNQFDLWDLNKDDDAQAAGNRVTYFSRLDWVGTFPRPVTVKYNLDMVNAARPQTYEPDEDLIAATEMPLLEQDLGDDGILLADLAGADFDDPRWEPYLSQFTVDELIANVTSMSGTAAPDLGVPGTRDLDGPTGVGETTVTGQEPVNATGQDLRAATFDAVLLEEVGRNLFGENMIHTDAGDPVISLWGMGANLHRTPYGGRNAQYYSEDGFVSGMAGAFETIGVQSVNTRAVAKHYLLNDMETNRHGVTTWANEQTIRELYLPAYELAAEVGGLEAMMNSFNRGGMVWTGQDRNIQENVLRGEFGMEGMFITDAYETAYEDGVDGIMGGTTRFLAFSAGPASLTEPMQERVDAGDTVFVTNLVDAVHHNLWHAVQTHAFDGYTDDTTISVVMPWWQKTLIASLVASILLAGAAAFMAVRNVRRKRQVAPAQI